MTEKRERPGPLRWLRHLLDQLLVRILSLSLFRSRCDPPPLQRFPATELPPAVAAKYVPIPRVKGLPVVGTLVDLIAAGGATQ